MDGAGHRPSAGQAILHSDGSSAEISPIIAGQDIYHVLDWLHQCRMQDLYRQAYDRLYGYVAGTVHRAVERYHHTRDANFMYMQRIWDRSAILLHLSVQLLIEAFAQ